MARTKAFQKEVVLGKAMELFWSKGYHDTSIKDLVDHLGLSRSSIYETFGDKEHLFIEALEGYLQQGQQRVRESLDTKVPLSTFLQAYFDQIVSNLCSDREHKGCFAVNCTVELAAHDENIHKKVREKLLDNFEHFVTNWSIYFAKKQEAGELDPAKDPEELATFLYASMSSLNLLSRKTTDATVLDRVVRSSIRAIVD